MSPAHSSQTTVGTDAQARCSGSDRRVSTVDLGISNTSVPLWFLFTLFAFLPEKLLFGNVGGHSSHPVHIYLHCFAWRGALDGFDGCPSKWYCAVTTSSYLYRIYSSRRGWHGCWCTEPRSTRSSSLRLRSRAKSWRRRRRLTESRPTSTGARKENWRLWVFLFWRPQFLCCTYVIGIFHGSLLQDEEKLKNTNKDLTMVKMKSMFAIGGF